MGRPNPQAPLSFHRTVTIETRGPQQLHDMTVDVDRFLAECGLESGVVVIQSLHTTAGLLLNERETGLQEDFREIADQLVPCARSYRHDDMSVRWENLCPEDYECPNGHAHLQHALFGSPAVTLAVHRCRAVIGRWQRLLLVEYDRARERRVHLQAFGVLAPSRHLPGPEQATAAGDGVLAAVRVESGGGATGSRGSAKPVS